MSGTVTILRGRRGSGKTLTLTGLGVLYSSFGWKIYSNFTLKGVDYIPINNDFLYSLDKNSNLRDCVLLLDELQTVFDSRSWKQGSHLTFSHFIQQIRKRNIHIIGTTQYLDTIEKRIRQHIDFLISCKFDESSFICLLTFYDLTSFEDSSIPDSFEVSYYSPALYKYYNTYEIL